MLFDEQGPFNNADDYFELGEFRKCKSQKKMALVIDEMKVMGFNTKI